MTDLADRFNPARAPLAADAITARVGRSEVEGGSGWSGVIKKVVSSRGFLEAV